MRVLALIALSLLLGCESRVDKLLRQLESDDPNVRANAARDLGAIRGEPDPGYPFKVGLGPIPLRPGEQRVVAALTRRVRDDSSREVRYSAAHALARLRPPGRNDVLLDCAARDREVGTACADALLTVGDPANLEDMVGMLGMDGSAGRGRIMADIDELGAPLIPHLAVLVREDRGDGVTPHALRVLGQLDLDTADAVIVEALDSPISLHRHNAIMNLYDLYTYADADPKYLPLVEPLLRDPSPGVRAMAAKVLGVPEPPDPAIDAGVPDDAAKREPTP